ncbi:DUF1667 domain-containing protein [Anaerolentibacter hominis]|uniref:DUF1667 domain-containing protein n=1 Tax=Anaerolentibacter hominis TaxID=3079009 RepID=UPI0031B878F9
MAVKNLTCINCPLGCELEVELDDSGQVISVRGNTCRRGEEYARKEVSNPTRIVTTTVPVINGDLTVVSVKTRSDIPKNKIFDCIAAIKNLSVDAPVRSGDVVLKDIAGTGVDLIATKSVEKIESSRS